jgi:hypothetical protein
MVTVREWWDWQGSPAAGDSRGEPEWVELANALPPEVAALLGGPAHDPADPEGDEDDEAERWPAPGDPCATHTTSAYATYAACTPRFLAPAPLRSRSRRVRRHASKAR